MLHQAFSDFNQKNSRSRCHTRITAIIEPCYTRNTSNIWLHPTAQYAQLLLQQELKACYQAFQRLYPDWEELLNTADYSSFLETYLETTDLSPNHPFAHLVRPVMSFYGQVKDLLPQVEQIGVLQLINRVKPLFATQSRPCAELMLAALKAGRLTLISGEFLPEHSTPTILQSDGTQMHPNCIILATGFPLSIHPIYPQVGDTRCYRVLGTSLSAVHKRAASVAEAIVAGVSQSHAAMAVLQPKV